MSSGQSDDEAAVASIDETRGTYRSAGVADDAATVRLVFGRRAFAKPHREPITPLNAPIGKSGLPTVVSPPCKPTAELRRGRPRLALLRYDDVSFLFCDGRAFAWMVIADDARTSQGLGVGDDLDDVEDLYPAFTCAEAPSGDFRRYPYCAGAIAAQGGLPRLHVWFGEDPVASITISTTAYDGYEG
jgi:hypothetical protein